MEEDWSSVAAVAASCWRDTVDPAENPSPELTAYPGYLAAEGGKPQGEVLEWARLFSLVAG